MQHQRGEGKIGCIVSMLVLGTLGATAYKAVPIYYANSELIDACDFAASDASKRPIEVIDREVRQKAKELGIIEALTDKNAIRISKSGGEGGGTCTIVLHYRQTIDFYGVYKWTLETDKRITKPIFENIS